MICKYVRRETLIVITLIMFFMFITVKHKSLKFFAAIRELVKETYRVSLPLP